MKYKIYIVISTVTLIFVLINQNVQAQQNIAQQAYAIFEQSCMTCHGQEGSFKEALLIEYSELLAGGTVVPGNPEDSVLYQRLIETNEALRMPQQQPPLSAEAIETIRQWIAAGAPDWTTIPRRGTEFITNAVILETIQNHINSLSMRDRTYARYFTLTHLYNAGETTETLHAYRLALSKLVNSLSWGREVVNPKPIDTAGTLFYIDLRDYEWDVRNEAWAQIEQKYPYKIAFGAPTQTDLHEKLITLQQETSAEVPLIHVDWFLANASLPPLYHNILALPQTVNELEEQLEVFVDENLQNAPGKRVWRAGFNNSGVSQHNRVVERHLSRYGAYWKSYDFAGSTGSRHIFSHPLDFTHDGGEIIFNLPNGLQAYYLVDAGGNRLDVAPTDIVSNPAASDPAVRNGLSCIGCHTEGMKTFEDQVRAVVEIAENPSYDKAQALDLYAQKIVMDKHVAEDTARFQTALEKIGEFGDIEPVQRFHELFQRPLNATHAAAATGLETETFLDKISKNTTLQNLLGALIIENGTVKRDAWTANFDDVISELNSFEDDPLPPDPIPDAPIHIPDPNLRAAIETALAKAAGEEITVAEMATLIELKVPGLGIIDLTGLESATNLRELSLKDNQISDLSPIVGLIKLQGLWITNNPIFDIFPVQGLTNLTELVLDDTQVFDLSPIAGLINLKVLGTSTSLITDISPVKGLKNLTRLWFHRTQVSDLAPLAGLINLQHLGAWSKGHYVSDLSPLANLTNLKHLDMSGSYEITDISPLANLKNLTYLRLYDNSISDISALTGLTNLQYLVLASQERDLNLTPLANLTRLKDLRLAGNEISDIFPLSGLSALEWLDLTKNNISDISPLAKLTNLKVLILDRNKIEDVSPLAGLTNLKTLNISRNPITDFSPLAELVQNTKILFDVVIPDVNLRAVIVEVLGKEDATAPITFEEMKTLTTISASDRDIKDLTGLEYAVNLEILNASDNQITDLSPLSKLINLRVLNIWHNPVESLSPIAGLSNLETITLIGDGGISDISPLAGLVKLRHFLTWGNPISNLSPLANLTQIETLDICGSEASDISVLANLTGLKSLYLIGNGISDVSALSGLTSLERLKLEQNNISDVSPLSELTNLKLLTLNNNSISDFSSLSGLTKTTITRAFNPGVPKGGPKIEGPWLWVTVPGERLDNDTDLLAKASASTITEQQIATIGAKQGESVGNNRWTQGSIAPSGDLNIINLLDEIGSEINSDNNNHIIYGCVTLDSPLEQETQMFFGFGDKAKIWLNGTLVYQSFVWRRGTDYQDFVPVTLKQGVNVLLVAVEDWWEFGWSGHFGFEEGTEYTIIPPDMVSHLTFSVIEKDFLAGDTFTLNLNAENITDLAGWEGDISYDPNVLEAVEVTEGDFLKSGDATTFFQGGTIDNTTGKITGINIARITAGGVNGSGTLLSVKFIAKVGGDTYIALENFEFGSSSGDIIPAVPPNITITIGEYPPWDVNQDGRVSILDLILVAQDLGAGTPANLRTDVNRDGTINIQDLILVAQHIGESTDSTAAPSINGDELTPTIVQTWIKQAQIANDGSIAFQQGIENLQRLLASLIPEKTALLSNYPNPFNPETWVPYHLSKPAEVSLTIYTTNGTVVRTLTLGQQAAGMYQNRDRAAHWDGKNEQGEPVSSGIYFYTLTAGNFTATRKMLILK